METFSNALISLVRDRLGDAMAQYDSFADGVDAAYVNADFTTATVWVGEREFHRSGQLGSLAEDATFMWAWAKDGMHGLPGIAHSVRLREIGVEHDIPEFTTELVDLGAFDDPWLAADQLSLTALAVLGGRGITKFNHGGRAYTYLLIDDESVPVVSSASGNGRDYRQAAEELLAGGGPRTVNTGGPAPTGYRPGPVPDSLLPILAPSMAIVIATDDALLDAAPELRALEQREPVWDRARQRFYYAERPDLSFAAAEIGHFDDDQQLWEWSDSDFSGIAAARALAVEHGADHLAAAQVPLAAATRPLRIAYQLAASAAHRGGAGGLCHVPTATGNLMLALVDPEVSPRGTDPESACAAIENAADYLHPITPAHVRYPVMRALVAGFLEFHGATMMYVGEPHFTGAQFGLYEMRADFGAEGGLIRTRYGLIGTFA